MLLFLFLGVALGEWLTIDRGQWGDWNEGAAGRKGYFACGVQLRQDRDLKFGAIGLKLKFCKLEDWQDQYWQVIEENSGAFFKQDDLQQAYYMCPNDQYLRGG